MTTVAVAPFTYTTDTSIRNIQDVNATIDQFELNIIKIVPPDADYTVYLQRPIHEVRQVLGEEIYRISIDILDLVVAYNASTGTISVEAFVKVPVIGTVSVGQVSGNLTDGISLTVGYPDLLTGTISITYSNGVVTLNWEFTALGATFNGSLVLFSLSG